MRKLFIGGAIILLLICGCSKKSTGPDDPLAKIIGQISFGADTLITDINQPLIISFWEEMDQPSVERGLSFEPQFEYTTHWTTYPHCNESDPKCYPKYYQLYIYPENSFQTNLHYSGMIDTTAFDSDSFYLPRQYHFEFTTAFARLKDMKFIALEVDSQGGFPELINLHFNARMDSRTLQQPLTTTPQFEYKLSDSSNYNSVFQYRITSPLRAQTTYSVVLNDATIKDYYGNPLENRGEAQFTTDSIRVIYHFPNPDFLLKHDHPIIQVRFNTIMDREATQEAFLLTDSVTRPSGEFEWLTPQAMMYYLEADLLHGVDYYIIVDTTAADLYGQHLPQKFIHKFRLPN